MSNNYDADDIDNSAYIPRNFDESGRLFNGMIKLRNAIEAGVLGFFVYQFLNATVNIDDAITAMTVKYGVAGAIGVLALIGYQGDSLTQTIQIIIRYFKDRRKMRFRRIRKIDNSKGTIFGNKKVKAKNKKKKQNKRKKNNKKKSDVTKETRKMSIFNKRNKDDKVKDKNKDTSSKKINNKKPLDKEKKVRKSLFKKGGDK